MLKISRHPIKNIDFVLEELDYLNFEEDFNNIQERPQNLGFFCLEMLRYANISELGQLEHSQTINYLQLALLTGLAHFQSALYPGSSFNIYIGDKKLSFKGVETTAYIDPDQWQKLFHIAVILRDLGCLKTLCNIPESLMRKTNITGNEADFAIVRFYKGLYDKDCALDQLLMDAMLAINPNIHEGEREEYLFYIKGSELDLYLSIFSNEPNKYNENLAEAITNHRQYWGENEDKRYDNEGWISYPLTAASVIAHDTMNYPIEINSPYTPIWLVKHDF